MFRASRRRFLQQSAAAAGTAVVGLPAFAQTAKPSEKLNVAVIGVAHRGGANLAGVAGENIVALCDVDEKLLGAAAARFPAAEKFVDFRRMLDKVQRQIDAVVVSTPDHTHAPAAAAAMHLQKHCYCEKPLAHNVAEVRRLTELAAAQRVVTQIGTQIHAGANYRRVVELVQAGAIGPVAEVHVWVNVSYGGQDRPKDSPPVPAGLHWEEWLGPAPQRPYHPVYCPGSWRRWWDFGTGGLGDFGCHYMDLPFWALGLKYPTRIEAAGPPVHAEGTPAWTIVKYRYPARGPQPPVALTWYDGGKRPEQQFAEKIPDWKSAVLFVGAKGLLIADYGRHMLLPQEKDKEFPRPPRSIPDSIGHHAEWIQACKTGGPTTCPFSYSGPLSEAAILGTVAYRAGEALEWDGAAMKATNCPAAERWLRREYRKGWTL